MTTSDTKDTILDAAEKLFAVEGFHKSSIRAITREAGVNLASVNYYFGSKEALLEAVFERRLAPINSLRIQKLNTLMAGGATPELREVLRAFIVPFFISFDCSVGLRHIASLVNMSLSAADSTVRNTFVAQMQPAFDAFFKALGCAMPHMPHDSIVWKTHFFLGGFTHTIRISLMQDQSKAMMPHGLPEKINSEDLVDMMVAFFAAGMEAEC